MGSPASCKGPALSYIPPSLRAAIRTVLSDCTVSAQSGTVRNSSWSIQTCEKRTGSRFLILPQPLTARIALRLSDQTNIWPSTPGPQHRISISSSAEQQPRARPCTFPGHTETLGALACRGQNRSVANIRWPTPSLVHLTPSRSAALFTATKSVRSSSPRGAFWHGLGPVVALPDVALRTTVRRASGKMLTEANQTLLSLACPLHLGRREDLHSWDPHGPHFRTHSYSRSRAPSGLLGALSCLSVLLLQPCWRRARCHKEVRY